MAASNILASWSVLGGIPQSVNYPSIAVVAAIQTPYAIFPKAGTPKELIFSGILPPAPTYLGGGTTVRIIWMALAAGSGNVRWEASFQRLQDQVTLPTSTAFATAVAVNDALAGTSLSTQYSDITMTGNMDGAVAGDAFRLKISRNGPNAGDTATGIDVGLVRVALIEA